MPAPNTVDEFLDLIRKSGVVDEKRLNPYVEKLRAGGGMPAEPNKLAGLLIRDGILTHFQAEQLLMGKWRRFSIGKYKVLERIGSGGMGSVYLCEHKLMRRRVAVKVLPTAKAAEPSSLERFYREARAVASLDHPNIVHAYDIDQDESLHFLVMEYVDGASLQEIVKKTGPMDPVRAANYIYQSALGLEHAHGAGLVHRDIKPGNLLVDRHGTVKILDMGLARFFNDEEDILTKKYDENVLGTADYLAPEQAVDSHEADTRADIYSLGATFYFLLTGRTPFEEGTVAQKLIWHQTRQPKAINSFRSDVPGELLAIIDKMMAKRPEDRYQYPNEVSQALAHWAQRPIAPPLESEMPRLSLAALKSGPETTATGGFSTQTGPGSSRKNWQVTASATMPRPTSAPATPPTEPAARSPVPPPAAPPRSTPAAPTPSPGASPTVPAPAPGPRLAPPAAPAPPKNVTPPAPAAPAPPKNVTPPAPAAPAPPKTQSLPESPTRSTAAPEPVPTLPTLPGRSAANNGPAGNQFWADLADDTDPRGLAETSPLSAPSSSRGLSFENTQRFWLILTIVVGVGVVLVVVLLFSLLAHLFSSPGMPERRPLVVSKELVGEGTYVSIASALRAAAPGDVIEIADEQIEESVQITTHMKVSGIVLRAASGKQVVWTCKKGNEDRPLLQVSGVKGFNLEGNGITLDGQGKMTNLMLITGQCSGLQIRQARLRGYTTHGIRIMNCVGEEGTYVGLHKLQVDLPVPDNSVAVYLDANPSIFPDYNNYLDLRDCLFPGLSLKQSLDRKNAAVTGDHVKTPPSISW